jgi:hypothetical protein
MMNERRKKISDIVNRSFANQSSDTETVLFDKDEIIQEILENLPEDWIWFTVNKRMSDAILPHEEAIYPRYDLIITSKKLVKEQKNTINPYSAANSEYLYNINIGINVVPKIPIKNSFKDELVTIAVEVSSCRQLLNFLEEVDSEFGGIKPCKN